MSQIKNNFEDSGSPLTDRGAVDHYASVDGQIRESDEFLEMNKQFDDLVQSLSVRITDYYIVASCFQGYTVYTLRFNDFGFPMIVSRRFSDFSYLDDILRKNKRNFPGKLPEKKIFGNTAPSFVSQRYHGLRAYLSSLMIDPSYTQLILLCKFLGFSGDAFLYLELVISRTFEERSKAVSQLFRYLMLPIYQRKSFIDSLISYPINQLAHLSLASCDSLTPRAEYRDTLDFRLGHKLVFGTLLDALRFSDSKMTCEIGGIFLYMVHHSKRVRRMVMNVESVHYIIKALSRLLLDNSLQELHFEYEYFPDIRKSIATRGEERLNIFGSDNESVKPFWSVVTSFAIIVMNEMFDVVRLYVEGSDCLEKLCKLLSLRNSSIMKPFVAWLLWMASCEEDVAVIFPPQHTDFLLQNLYSSRSSAVKIMSGIIISSLLSSEWFDSESRPKAIVSLIQLLDNHIFHDELDMFYFSQFFRGISLSKFARILENVNLDHVVKLYLISILRKFISQNFFDTSGIEKKFNINLEKIAKGVDFSGISSLEGPLMEPLSPEIYFDFDFANPSEKKGEFPTLATNKETFFKFVDVLKPIFTSLYIEDYREISETVSPSLFSLMDATCEIAFRSTELRHECARCLLLLPWSTFTSNRNAFELNISQFFSPKPTQIFSNGVYLEKLGVVTPIHERNTGDFSLDCQNALSDDKPEGNSCKLEISADFISNRLMISSTFLAAIKSCLEKYEAIHKSNNETVQKCVASLYRLMSAKELTSAQNWTNLEFSTQSLQSNPIDILRNFEFDVSLGDYRIFLTEKDFKRINQAEILGYFKELSEYEKVELELFNVIKFAVTYHKLCEHRLKHFGDILNVLELRLSKINPSEFDDLTDLEDEFVTNSMKCKTGMENESVVMKKLLDSTTMLKRTTDTIKENRTKINACKLQISITEDRIKKIPQTQAEANRKREELELQCQKLEKNIKRTVDDILSRQSQTNLYGDVKKQAAEKFSSTVRLFSILDEIKGQNLQVVTQYLDIVSDKQTKMELSDEISKILSRYGHIETINTEVLQEFRQVIFKKLQESQSNLEEICNDNFQAQISALNKSVIDDEAKLYKLKSELVDVKKSHNLSANALEEALEAQTTLLNSLESANSNISTEIERISGLITTMEKQLANLKNENANARAKQRQSKIKYLKEVESQRLLRLATFSQMLTLEFLSRKIWLEGIQIECLLNLKPQVLGIVRKYCKHEIEARDSLCKTLEDAAKRFERTALFLRDQCTR